jgi:dTDP-4-amino-4,6-dideoxygalactose transaminase
MVVTLDAYAAARLRRPRDLVTAVSAVERNASRQPVIELHLETGFYYRMADIQAAIGNQPSGAEGAEDR